MTIENRNATTILSTTYRGCRIRRFSPINDNSPRRQSKLFIIKLYRDSMQKARNVYWLRFMQILIPHKNGVK